MIRKKLQGQVAIVTGASRGIGAAAAALLAEAGAAVVVTARGATEVEGVAATLRNRGGRAIGVAADVADPEQVEEVVESALDQFGRVDILVNNAAIVWPLEEIADTDADEWTYSVQVNLLGPFYLARNVLPVMLHQGSGRILNITSGAAVSPIVGVSAYCTSKAGLDMLTRVLAKEVDGTGVTANALDPGMVNTDMQADIRSVDTSDTRLDFGFWHDQYEHGALAAPADVARLIYWVVGPWGRDHNGVIFRANDAVWREQVRADLGEQLHQAP
jgi:NAD(P)-dependent dehydrogenase (short-subunit alcohol dehydrogenase family)